MSGERAPFWDMESDDLDSIPTKPVTKALEKKKTKNAATLEALKSFRA